MSQNPSSSNPLVAEIIAVGTELLMGEVTNTNASWLSSQMADLGLNVYYHTTVGDNPQRIKNIFQIALARADILLVTGGLGPTDDDLTVATLAEMFGVPMHRDATVLKKLESFFISRNMPMSKLNLKQADCPEGAEFLDNPAGTAPGVFWDVRNHVDNATGPKIIICMPGVPREMKVIFTESVMPRFREMGLVTQKLFSSSLKFFGIGESALAEKVRYLLNDNNSPVTVSPYVGQAEVRLRLAVKAATDSEAELLLAPVRAEILKRAGDYYFGQTTDTLDETLESQVAALLFQKNWTLAVAESCTGGLISSRLTDVPGSSAYTKLNVVTYANDFKTSLLNVPSTVITDMGAVSESVALAMAEGVQKLSGCDIGLSITGIAGPSGGTTDKQVGLAYIAIQLPNAAPETYQLNVNPTYSRDRIKHWFSQYALFYLYQALSH